MATYHQPTLCTIRRVEYNYTRCCEHCRKCQKPGTPMLTITCSCGCEAVNSCCLRCPLGYCITVCARKMRKSCQEKSLLEKECGKGKKMVKQMKNFKEF